VLSGILSYGMYVPQFRLDRRLIAAALNAGSGRGTRSAAGHDEDATTMGVAAARQAVQPLGSVADIGSVWFATTQPPYLDKTNATAIHAAMGIPSSAGAYDMIGSVRSGVGAVLAALGQSKPSLVVLSDLRSGLPGGADERDGGDAAVALVVGTGETICEVIGTGSRSAEFLDRWREPQDRTSRSWEDRFGEQVLLPLGQQAIFEAQAAAQVDLSDVDHLLVCGSHERATRSLRKRLTPKVKQVVSDRGSTIGNPGTAQLGLALADALDVAQPGEIILAVNLADGADVLVLRATAALPGWRARRVPRPEFTASITYPTYLMWRGQLHREPPRRPEPDIPVAPASFRERSWKFAFGGSRCAKCGTLHLPPQRVCASCSTVDQMVPESVAEATGVIVAVTADHLAFSEDPPMTVAIVDFDGGGRVQCELTDHGGLLPEIGDRVEMTFRRAFTSGGVHNYVWKARPVREEAHG
jgi:hydroxymethylglutaryl-CoA synthase